MTKQKSIIESLKKLFSEKDIITLLNRIDEDIQGLHTCSSDDFLNLNNHFKNYYKDSKEISSNSTAIFQIVSGESTRLFNSQIKSYINEHADHLEFYKTLLSYCENTLGAILSSVESLMFPVKNLKQNLMSLKFVITNIKLNLTYSVDTDKSNLDKADKMLEVIISSIKELSPQIDENVNHLKVKIKQILDKLGSEKKKEISQLDTLYQDIGEGIKYLSVKQEKSKEETEKVTEKSNSCSKNIADIITNLQYQDIIRQKMEHIQESHKNIIEKLSKLESLDEQNETDQLYLDYFIQIRDIAGLQAAQLLLVNKEYQSAIEIISKSFREIGSQLTEISTISNSFFELNLKNAKTPLSELGEQLGEIVKLNQVFHKNQLNSKDQIDYLLKDVSELADQNTKIRNLNKRIKEFAYDVMVSLEPYFKDKEIASASKQIKSLSVEIDNECESISNIVKVVNSNGYKLLERFEKYTSDEFGSDETTDLLDKIENIKTEYDKINNLLIKNTDVTSNVSTDIDKTLSEVQYYDYFEKVIEKIIDELNTINFKLKAITGDLDTGDKLENLNQLKMLYTMKSEHDIHDKVLGSSDNSDDFLEGFDDSNSEGDDDNLELF